MLRSRMMLYLAHCSPRSLRGRRAAGAGAGLASACFVIRPACPSFDVGAAVGVVPGGAVWGLAGPDGGAAPGRAASGLVGADCVPVSGRPVPVLIELRRSVKS